MTREEIMKQLDKFEIAYESDANKPVLQKLLDDELARRAEGVDDNPLDTSADEPEVDEPEPEISEDERAKRYAAAAEALAKATAAKEAAHADAVAASADMGKYAGKGNQLSLADANKHFQKRVKHENAVKVQTHALMSRFAQEAEEMLDTANAE